VSTKPAAGYSGTPLIKKLGFAAGDTVAVHRPPEWYAAWLGDNGVAGLASTPTTWAHGFFIAEADLAAWLAALDFESIEKGLWVSWPKQVARVPTDLTEQTFRDLILPLGWVDTKSYRHRRHVVGTEVFAP
jgi:hypothetical protein